MGAIALLWCLHAQALFIGITPASGSHAVGTPFSVALLLSDMPSGQALSGYDFDVGFDPAVLSLLTVTESNALCDQSGSSQCQGDGTSSFLSAPGTGIVNLRDLSFAADAQLLAQQGDPLTLLVLTFIGIAEGSSAFNFANVNGLAGILDPQTNIAADLMLLGPVFGVGSVTITAASIPEPGTVTLLGLALALLAQWRRRLCR